jgi:hypothetical protein
MAARSARSGERRSESSAHTPRHLIGSDLADLLVAVHGRRRSLRSSKRAVWRRGVSSWRLLHATRNGAAAQEGRSAT